MVTNSYAAKEIGDLRQYIHESLCNQNELEPGAFPQTEVLLVKQGKPCGLLFCLHGPRSVKLTAIWEIEKNTVLFYGSDGGRLRKTNLLEAPDLLRHSLPQGCR